MAAMHDTLDKTGRPVETDETHRLISSDKVESTEVYNRNGDHLGMIDHLMIDKFTGHVEYAVMSFGGFLGIGEGYHPISWKVLTYDTQMGGYVIDADRSQLERAPRYTLSNQPEWDRTYRSRIDEYWIPPA